MSLLSTRNIAFSRLLAQIIRLRAQFPNHPIKTIRLDNTSELSSQMFLYYCMSLDIDVQYLADYVHNHNGLAESFIKRMQLIVRPLLLKNQITFINMEACYFTRCKFNLLLSYN